MQTRRSKRLFYRHCSKVWVPTLFFRLKIPARSALEPDNACRILRSVLLSAAVIVVQPVLIIEVGTHWQRVMGIKSYLTLSEWSRSHSKTVHLWMSLCICHSVDVHCECHFVDVALSKLISLFHFIDITLKISLC